MEFLGISPIASEFDIVIKSPTSTGALGCYNIS